MPRNSGGTYSLPAGNPVVTGTTISSTWANTTLTDLATAMTDSLSRTGQGGMLTTLLLADGTAGAPGLSWTNETTSGLYRAGAGDHRYSLSGTDKVQITTNGARVADGVVGTPAMSFISDTDLGFWRNAANDMRAAAGGADVAFFQAAGFMAYLQPGLVGTPSLTFFGDTNLGLYRAAADYMAFAANGVFQGGVSTNGLNMKDGTAGAPSYTFDIDPDNGMYRVTTNTLGFSAGGVLRLSMATNVAIEGSSSLFINDGTLGLPGIAFNSDSDTGISRQSTNGVAIVGGGTQIMNFLLTGGSPQCWAPSGSLSAPIYSFASGSNYGMWLDSGLVTTSANGVNVEAWGAGGCILGVSGAYSWTINTTVSSSATAGGTAVPATVAGYWVVSINGTTRKIPYYAN